MTLNRFPHDVLDLPADATEDAVRRAYRKQAFRLHPDRNRAPDAAERFLELRAAYEALSDPTTRDTADVQEIVRNLEDAAAEARRRRRRAGETAQAWQLVRIGLERPLAVRLGDAVASWQTWVGAGLGVLLAATVVVAVAALGWAVGWGAVGAVAGLALVGVVGAGVEGRPWAVEAHWQGLRDLRWDVRIAWDEIAEVHLSDRALDLDLTADGAARIRAYVPGEAWTEAGRYHLPTSEATRLAGLIRTQLPAPA